MYIVLILMKYMEKRNVIYWCKYIIYVIFDKYLFYEWLKLELNL